MKSIYFVIAFLLPFIVKSQKSYTFSPYYPQPVHYIDGGIVVAKSAKDSSVVVSYYSGNRKDALYFLILNNYKNKAIFYEDIQVYDGKKNIPLYTANEILLLEEKRFRSSQNLSKVFYALNSNPEQKKTSKHDFQITDGYSTIKIKGESTTVEHDANASIERIKMFNEALRTQAVNYNSNLRELAENLLYLPDDSEKIEGDVVLKSKLKDQFTVFIIIGDDKHEIKFRKSKK